MQSAAHRSFTVVTLITLIFTPVFKNHHWFDVLVGHTTETKIVQCQPSQPCPAHEVIVKKVVVPKG